MAAPEVVAKAAAAQVVDTRVEVAREAAETAAVALEVAAMVAGSQVVAAMAEATPAEAAMERVALAGVAMAVAVTRVSREPGRQRQSRTPRQCLRSHPQPRTA